MYFKSSMYKRKNGSIGKVLLAILSIVLVGGIAYVATMFEPRPVTDVEKKHTPKELIAMSEESYDLEYQFRDILKYRKPTDEDLKLLEKSYMMQRQYMEAVNYDDAEGGKRLREVKKLYMDFASERLFEQSAEAEGSAKQLFDNGKYAESIPFYKKAIELQNEINSRFQESRFYSVGRSSRLTQFLRESSARIVGDQSRAFEKKAEAALAAGDKEAAETAYKAALELQEKLNTDTDYMSTSQRNYQRLDALKASYRILVHGETGKEEAAANSEYYDKSVEEEKLFNAAVASGKVDAVAMSHIKAAVAFQEKYSSIVGYKDPVASERLRQLKRVYHSYAAAPLYEKSLEAEERANIAIDKRKYADAKGFIKEAVSLQEQINESYPQSMRNDRSRVLALTRLNASVDQMPVLDKIDELESSATEAMVKKDWPDAVVAYKKALDLQESINNERALRTGNENEEKSKYLRRKWTTALSSGTNERIMDAVQNGNKFFQEKKYDEASKYFGDAVSMQKDLNNTYALSEYASKEKINEYEMLFETASGHDKGTGILDKLQQIEVLLKAKKAEEGSAMMEDLNENLEAFDQTYPASTQITAEQKKQIRYLFLIRKNLALIQAELYADLLVLEGSKYLLKTEVSQKIFSDVTGKNPSRNRTAETLPVESVKYEEALSFCTRVSWILCTEVRLPTEKEFQAAVGVFADYDAEKSAWSLVNSNREIHPVATKEANKRGFYDLFGNVSEWVRKEGETGGFSIGGSVADSFSDHNLVAKKQSIQETSPYLGFRFVAIF